MSRKSTGSKDKRGAGAHAAQKTAPWGTQGLLLPAPHRVSWPRMPGLQKPHHPEVVWTKEAEGLLERAAGSRAWPRPCPTRTCASRPGDAGRARHTPLPHPVAALTGFLKPPPAPRSPQRPLWGHPPEEWRSTQRPVQSHPPHSELAPTVPGAGACEVRLLVPGKAQSVHGS